MIFLPLAIVQIDELNNKEFMIRLYEEYARLMQYQAYQICKDSSQVDDIIQDSLVKLISKLDIIRGLIRPALVSYVMKTVKYTALNTVTRDERRNHYQNCSAAQLDKQAFDDRTPEMEYLQKEQMENLKEALSRLSERDRDLLDFKYILGLSNKEISQSMGIPAQQVSWYVCLARRKAYKIMQDMEDSEHEKG